MSAKTPGTTVAGLAMGSLGLGITLYKTAIDAYSVFTTASSLGKDVSFFQAELLIQQERLKGWGDVLGLRGGRKEPDERLNSDTSLFRAIVAVLVSINMILTDLDDLRTVYGIHGTGETPSQGHPLGDLAATKLIDTEALFGDYVHRLKDIEMLQIRLSILKKLR